MGKIIYFLAEGHHEWWMTAIVVLVTAQNKSNSKTAMPVFKSGFPLASVLICKFYPVKEGADSTDLLPSTPCTRCSQLCELVFWGSCMNDGVWKC